MSLESWKAEFYQVEARDVPAGDALDHSIRKWEGLRRLALKRHGGHHEPGLDYVTFDCGGKFAADETSCALCQCFFVKSEDLGADEGWCNRCPLAGARGGVMCVGRKHRERVSPYTAFLDGDPRPMLRNLRRAKAMVRT